MSTTFALNLNAARAQRAEATGEKFRVQLGDDMFDFPNVMEWPITLMEALQAGDMVRALRMLLSAEDVDRFLTHNPTIGDFNDVFEALGKAAGVGGLGNSQGSAKS